MINKLASNFDKNWIELLVGHFIVNFDKEKNCQKNSRIVIKNGPLFYSKILFKINKRFVKLYHSKMLVKELLVQNSSLKIGQTFQSKLVTFFLQKVLQTLSEIWP